MRVGIEEIARISFNLENFLCIFEAWKFIYNNFKVL